MNRRETGSIYENGVTLYLEKKGYRIIGRNVSNRFGEIDIICISPDKNLVFTEVKYRKDHDRFDPLEAVDARKIRRICKASAFYIGGHPEFQELQVRYDVIGVYDRDDIRHIENAFEYVG